MKVSINTNMIETISLPLECFLSSFLYFERNLLLKFGVTPIDTTNDAKIVIIRVFGKILIICPIMPPCKANGINAPTVVIDAAITAGPTWLDPILAAVILSRPLSLNRSMFSITTMALSTRRPSAMTKATRDILLIVMPPKFITIKEIKSDKGMTTATINDSFKPMNTKSSAMTTSNPPNALLNTVSKLSATWSLSSDVMITLRSSGKTKPLPSSINALILSDIPMMSAPVSL